MHKTLCILQNIQMWRWNKPTTDCNPVVGKMPAANWSILGTKKWYNKTQTAHVHPITRPTPEFPIKRSSLQKKKHAKRWERMYTIKRPFLTSSVKFLSIIFTDIVNNLQARNIINMNTNLEIFFQTEPEQNLSLLFFLTKYKVFSEVMLFRRKKLLRGWGVRMGR